LSNNSSSDHTGAAILRLSFSNIQSSAAGSHARSTHREPFASEACLRLGFNRLTIEVYRALSERKTGYRKPDNTVVRKRCRRCRAGKVGWSQLRFGAEPD